MSSISGLRAADIVHKNVETRFFKGLLDKANKFFATFALTEVGAIYMKRCVLAPQPSSQRLKIRLITRYRDYFNPFGTKSLDNGTAYAF